MRRLHFICVIGGIFCMLICTACSAAGDGAISSKDPQGTRADYLGTQLIMPDRIELSIDQYDRIVDMTIERSGDQTLMFTTPDGVFEYTLNEDAVRIMNDMYQAITDFSTSKDQVFEDEGDVAMWIGNEVFRYHYGVASQPQLDLYIDYVASYIYQASPLNM